MIRASRYRVLTIFAFSLGAFALIGALLIGARARPLQAAPAPAIDCSIVSCTLHFPILLRNHPASWPMETTQAVQQPDNSVKLIQDRPTFVRLTLTSTVAYANVSAYLYGSRGGVALPGSPIAAINNPRTLLATANRSALNDTFNFSLPASWRNGTVSLYASATNGSTFNAASSASTFTFIAADPLNVTVVPVQYTCNDGNGGTTTPAGPYTYLTDYTYRVYPISTIISSTHAAMTYSGPCDSSSGLPKPTENDWDGIGGLLDKVTDIWFSDGAPGSYYYALVKIDCGGGCIAGIGWIGAYKAAVGFDGFGSAHVQASETHAHEVGHNHGRSHTWGCGAGGNDPSFPYVTGGRGYIGNASKPNYGFDIYSLAIMPYGSYYDVMNYCDPQWISDYTYEALRVWNLSHNLFGPPAAQGDRTFFVSGAYNPVGDRVTLSPIYTLNIPARLPAPGDYTLELLDISGRVLAAYPFDMAQAHADVYSAGGSATTYGFRMGLPYVDGLASVRVRRGSEALGALDAGIGAPALRAGIAAPSDDGASLRVNWSGTDGDGERLSYLVRASTDGGATWQTIGVNLITPAIDLNPIDFSGKEVQLEVYASDGLHTAKLKIGPLAVP